MRSEIWLERMAPERIVVLPRDANRPFYDAVLAACSNAGLSPTITEMPDANVERSLPAAASGAGMALVPEWAAERFAPAIVTRRDLAHMPTVALLHAVSRTVRRPRSPRRAHPPRRRPERELFVRATGFSPA